jgi:hypothetical protein
LAGVIDGDRLVLLPRVFFGGIGLHEGIVWAETGPALIYTNEGRLAATYGETAGMEVFASAGRTSALILGRASSSAFGGERVYMTDGLLYEVRSYDRSMTPQRIMRIVREARPVTQETVTAYVEAALSKLEEQDRLRGRQIFEGIPSARQIPWISSLMVHDLDQLWVQEYSPDARSRRWIVFGAAGGLLGSVTLPDGRVVLQIGADFVMGLETDDLGVQHVRIYGSAADPTGSRRAQDLGAPAGKA